MRTPWRWLEPRSLRRAYLDEFGRFLKELQRGCRGQQIDYLSLRTDQSLAITLSAFLAARMHRVK